MSRKLISSPLVIIGIIGLLFWWRRKDQAEAGDPVEITGCTDPDADNFNPDATADDGSCVYLQLMAGCTNPNAINYNSNAIVDDGSCVCLFLEEDEE